MLVAFYILYCTCLCSLLPCVHSKCSPPEPIGSVEISETATAGGPAIYKLNAVGSNVTIKVAASSSATKRSFIDNFELRNINNSLMGVYVIKPVDLDNDYQSVLTSKGEILLTLTFLCVYRIDNSSVIFSRILKITPADEYDPYFLNSESFLVREDEAVGTTVANILHLVRDDDLDDQKNIYQFKANFYKDYAMDGFNVFKVTREGSVILIYELDYERGDHIKILNVTAKNYKMQVTSALIEFLILNVDDSPVVFMFSECPFRCNFSHYSVMVEGYQTGVINRILHGPVRAYDEDDQILEYSLIGGSPKDYAQYITIDKNTGELTLINVLADLDVGFLDLVIQAKTISFLPKSNKENMESENITFCIIWINGHSQPFFIGAMATSGAGEHKPQLLYVFGLVLMFIAAFNVVRSLNIQIIY